MNRPLDRRSFMGQVIGAAGVAGVSRLGGFSQVAAAGADVAAATGVNPRADAPAKVYGGPNVIIVRFGGGVRRRETIDPQGTYSPYLLHDLAKRGTLFTDMNIAQIEGVNTSHGEGTLNILTGKYDKYTDVDDRFLGARFEAKVPTVFEYLRKQYDVPAHQALIVNGEDRTDEEFYTFSNHHSFGVRYRSNVLSLYRFKCHLLARQIEEGKWRGEAREEKRRELEQMLSLDQRRTDDKGQGEHIDRFWDGWRGHYGETGFVNPRGDRLLTALSIRAIKQLRPRLMMVNYQDPDYVHWGNIAHYTRGIAVIDQGLRQLVATVEADEHYRDNTIFVVVPDCGRDSNRFMAVPCQHHFNSRSSHEIWALAFGAGVAKGSVVDKAVDQSAIAATVGKLMGFDAKHAEGDVLGEVWA